MKQVIDISKHQKSFDPYIAKKHGVDAVIMRLAYGASEDTLATSWIPRTKAQGLKIGGYGFATWHYKEVNGGDIAAARNHMRKQVKSWIDIAKRNGVDWWLAIDQELEKKYSMSLSMDENTQIINEAADMIRNAGFTPLLYCSVAWDFEYVRTSQMDPALNYWFAYYPTAIRDKGFGAAAMNAVPTGIYGNWFRKVYANGRLAGWQYGSTGHGEYYGCGSENVDRDIFYTEPDNKVFGVTDLHAVKTDPMSQGDLDAVQAVLDSRQINFEIL